MTVGRRCIHNAAEELRRFLAAESANAQSFRRSSHVVGGAKVWMIEAQTGDGRRVCVTATCLLAEIEAAHG